jgi:hypothetical protein
MVTGMFLITHTQCSEQNRGIGRKGGGDAQLHECRTVQRLSRLYRPPKTKILMAPAEFRTTIHQSVLSFVAIPTEKIKKRNKGRAGEKRRKSFHCEINR